MRTVAPTAVVYWLLADTDEVIYVGMTWDLRRRLRQHELQRPWWSEVASVAHTDPMRRSTAERVEREHIMVFLPRHNVVGAAPSIPAEMRDRLRTHWPEVCSEPRRYAQGRSA